MPKKTNTAGGGAGSEAIPPKIDPDLECRVCLSGFRQEDVSMRGGAFVCPCATQVDASLGRAPWHLAWWMCKDGEDKWVLFYFFLEAF